MKMYNQTRQLIGTIKGNVRALSVFGEEFEDIYKEKKKEWREALKDYDAIHDRIPEMAGTDMWKEPILEQMWFVMMPRYQQECLRERENFKMLMRIYKAQKRKGYDYAFNIEKARDFPIHELAGVDRHKRRVQTSCPLHSDSTPSMMVYNDSNSFFCYSCSAGGSSIDWVMAVEGLSFKQAVRRLNDDQA